MTAAGERLCRTPTKVTASPSASCTPSPVATTSPAPSAPSGKPPGEGSVSATRPSRRGDAASPRAWLLGVAREPVLAARAKRLAAAVHARVAHTQQHLPGPRRGRGSADHVRNLAQRAAGARCDQAAIRSRQRRRRRRSSGRGSGRSRRRSRHGACGRRSKTRRRHPAASICHWRRTASRHAAAPARHEEDAEVWASGIC